MKKLFPIAFLAVVLLGGCASTQPSTQESASPGGVAGEVLPARFEHNRVFVFAESPDGEKVRFYTDTGGGFNAITRSVAERFGLETFDSGKADFPLVRFPQFFEDSGIPRPMPDPWLDGNLAVVPDGRLKAQGLLGSRWFAGRIWRFDYPARTLSVLEQVDIPAGFEEVSLGFRTDESGARDLNFPRIAIKIEGEPLEMLLDTGATAQLAKDAAARQGLPIGTLVGASYIIRSKFEQWRDRHPDWRVIMDGEEVTGRAFPMIEVPEVQIGDIRVGPVWFSVRPDETFLEWMSGMMDRQIVGAVGGSTLQYLRMIIDYPKARAYLQVPRDDVFATDDS